MRKEMAYATPLCLLPINASSTPPMSAHTLSVTSCTIVLIQDRAKEWDVPEDRQGCEDACRL